MPLKSAFAAFRFPGTWVMVAGLTAAQLLIGWLFAFSFTFFIIFWMSGLYVMLTGAGVAVSAYFASKPRLRRRAGLLLALGCLLYLQLALQPENRYGVRPLTEVRGALSATLSYEALPQRLLHQKPEPPYALRTALLHKYRDEMPERSWLISFSYDEGPATLSAFGAESGAEPFSRFYLFNLRNEQIGSNHPNMINARFTDEPRRLMVDIMHDGKDFRYEIPLYYTGPQPLIVPGYSLADPAREASAMVYIHLTDAAQHSRFQQVYYDFLSTIYGPNLITRP